MGIPGGKAAENRLKKSPVYDMVGTAESGTDNLPDRTSATREVRHGTHCGDHRSLPPRAEPLHPAHPRTAPQPAGAGAGHPDRRPLFARQLEARCGDVPVYTADREVLARLTGYALTRGMLCAMRRPALPDAEAVCRNSRRVAVLENITDASNVGALFRSAAALGMDAVLVTPSCCDPFYRRAIRVSMGAVFQLPWAWIGQGEGQWPRAGLALLRKMGFRTAAMALSGSSISIEEPRLAQAERLAVLLGSEGTSPAVTTPSASPWPTVWTPSTWPPPAPWSSGSCGPGEPPCRPGMPRDVKQVFYTPPSGTYNSLC